MAETKLHDKKNDAPEEKVPEAESTQGAAGAADSGDVAETGVPSEDHNDALREAEDLVAKVASLEEQRDQYKDALVRERADFENYKKRNAAASAISFDSGVVEAAGAVLPVLDNFERALASECQDKAFKDGMEMIMRQLKGAMEGLGVTEMDTSGEFDPVYHHAVMQTEEPDVPSNTITETLQKGYMLKDKVLRPAMVKVNK